MSYDETVLVTGYPAFRGRKMVDWLLRSQPESLIYVVVHDKFADEAEQHTSDLSHAERSRLVLLEGDAAAMDLGLSGAEYLELASRVERIHHCAQVTFPGVDKQKANEVNLGATREIVELGRSCSQLKSIVIHSSAIVSGDRTGVVYEGELNQGQNFRTAVGKSLARAELIIRKAMDELPLCVIRPTHIVGDSASGEVDRLDGFYTMIRLIFSAPVDVPIPLPTRGDTPLNLVPIDFVVKAAQYLGRHPAAVGKTFHLADSAPLTVREVFERVAEAAGRRLADRFIPSGVAKAVLGVPGVHLFSKSQRALVDLLATDVRYDTSQADELLSNTDIRCPAFESYAGQLLDYVRRRLEEPRGPEDGAIAAELER